MEISKSLKEAVTFFTKKKKNLMQNMVDNLKKKITKIG